MKKLTRAASMANTAFSCTETTTKELSRLPSMCFDSVLSSPKSRRITKGRKFPKKRAAGLETGLLEVLEFKSGNFKKKYKLNVFFESDVLTIKKKFATKLVNTPGADFDCQSEDDLIEDTIKQKLKELRAGLNKIKKAKSS